MKMYVSGKWIESNETINVFNPYDGQIVDTVPKGNSEDVYKAIASAVRGFADMSALPGYRRFEILRKTADLLEERIEEFAKIIKSKNSMIPIIAQIDFANEDDIVRAKAAGFDKLVTKPIQKSSLLNIINDLIINSWF